jgi:hypothetical protein
MDLRNGGSMVSESSYLNLFLIVYQELGLKAYRCFSRSVLPSMHWVLHGIMFPEVDSPSFACVLYFQSFVVRGSSSYVYRPIKQ